MKRLFWFSLAFVLPAIMIACGKKNNNTDNTIATAPLTNQCLNPAAAQTAYPTVSPFGYPAANAYGYYGSYGSAYGAYGGAYGYGGYGSGYPTNSYYPYSQQVYPQVANPGVPTATCNNTAYSQYYGFAPYSGNISNYGYGATGLNLCDCGSGWRPVYNNELGMGCASNSVFTTVGFGAFYYTLAANNSQWVNIPQVSNTQGYSNSSSCYQNVAQACWVDVANSCGAGNICVATSGGSRLGICARQ